MTQTLYAHMNKIKFKKSKKIGKIFVYFSREDMWITWAHEKKINIASYRSHR
jgi:hypothetical protein